VSHDDEASGDLADVHALSTILILHYHILYCQ